MNDISAALSFFAGAVPPDAADPRRSGPGRPPRLFPPVGATLFQAPMAELEQ
jgi:hypothetical protein